MTLLPAVGSPENCGTLIGSGAPVRAFEKPTIASRNFSILTSAVNRITSSAASAPTTYKNANVIEYSGTNTITDYTASAQVLNSTFNEAVTITSLTPSVLQSPINGVATGVASGWATLKGTTASGEFSLKRVQVSATAFGSSFGFVSFRTGSLAQHIVDGIDNRIAGKTGSSIPLFTTRDNANNNYVRNAGNWAADVDLTGIAVATINDPGGQASAGVLISPRHLLFAAHYQPTINSQFRFVTQNNQVVTRTLTNKSQIPGFDWNRFPYADFAVGVLDSDVPNTIGFFKILPQNWRSWLPNQSIAPYTEWIVSGSTPSLPAFWSDQTKQSLVSNLDRMENTELKWIVSAGYGLPPSRSAFGKNPVMGDSGSPVGLIINNQLVLVGLVATSGGAGSAVAAFKTEINASMTTLGGGYQLTEIDLSGFPSY